MITWDNALLDCQDTTNDYSTTALNLFKRRLNQGYKHVLATFARSYTEVTKTSLTVMNQQYYQVPFDLIFPQSVTVTSGNSVFTLGEIESQDQWNMLNVNNNTSSSVPQVFFYRPRFGVNGGDIGVWPIPSTAGMTITLVYSATDKDLSQTAVTAGTATLTNGSNIVTGAATTFVSSMIGRYFQVTQSDSSGDGYFYKVVSVQSPNQLTVEQTYEGPSVSGATYQVAEVFALPEDMHVIPEYYALWHYYLYKQDTDTAEKYNGMYMSDMAMAQKVTYGKKSRSNIIRRGPMSKIFNQTYPINFPQNGIGS